MDIELICADCREALRNIPDGSIDLVVTDPPYDICVTGRGGTVNSVKKLRNSLQDLKRNTDITNGYDIRGFGELFLAKMREPNIYLWCNKKQIPAYLDFYIGEHKCGFDILTWHKTNALPTYSNKYLTDTEFLLYFRRGKGKCFPQSYEDAKTYTVEPINHADKKIWGHPTIKPLDITERIIRNSSREGQTILDPFMGSGTTGVAAKSLGRNFIGIEIDEGYFGIAQKRINETRGKTNE